MKKQDPQWHVILRRTVLIAVLIVGLALTGLAVHFILGLVVGVTLGRDMVNDTAFYLAVVCMSLTIYLFLVVFVTRHWDTLKANRTGDRTSGSRRPRF